MWAIIDISCPVVNYLLTNLWKSDANTIFISDPRYGLIDNDQ